MTKNYKRILIIDDDYCQNMLAILSVKKLLSVNDIDITAFTDPTIALEFIEKEYTTNPVKTIMFLDVNMTKLSGWDVLSHLSNLPRHIQEHFTINMLTSSIDSRDISKAQSYPSVCNYLKKPLFNHIPTLFKDMIAKPVTSNTMPAQQYFFA